MVNVLDADLKVYVGKELTARDFSILIEKMFPGRAGILYGCSITKIDSNTIHVDEGWLIIRGRLIHVTAGDIIVELPATKTTKYIVAACRLGNSANPATIEVGDSALDTGTLSFNESAGSAYMTLAQVTATKTGLSDDLSMVSGVIPLQPCIRSGTSAPTSSTPGRSGDIYIQYSK